MTPPRDNIMLLSIGEQLHHKKKKDGLAHNNEWKIRLILA